MDETEYQIARTRVVVEALTTAYVELNRIKAREPGEASHMIADSIQFIARQIKEIVKEVVV